VISVGACFWSSYSLHFFNFFLIKKKSPSSVQSPHHFVYVRLFATGTLILCYCTVVWIMSILERGTIFLKCIFNVATYLPTLISINKPRPFKSRLRFSFACNHFLFPSQFWKNHFFCLLLNFSFILEFFHFCSIALFGISDNLSSSFVSTNNACARHPGYILPAEKQVYRLRNRYHSFCMYHSKNFIDLMPCPLK